MHLRHHRHLRHHQNTYPLNLASPGDTVDLVAIQGGKRLHKRLADLGLNIGMPVRIIQGTSGGPMLLAFKGDSRLAIGHGVAVKIIVSPHQPSPAD